MHLVGFYEFASEANHVFNTPFIGKGKVQGNGLINYWNLAYVSGTEVNLYPVKEHRESRHLNGIA